MGFSSTHLSSSSTSSQSLDLRRSFNPKRGCFQQVKFNGRRPKALSCLNVGVKAPEKSVGEIHRSKEVMEAEAKVMVGAYARAPVVLASGKGCKLYDVEGREYLDMTSGIAVNALGHSDPDWVRAVVEQANVLTHVSNVYYSVPQVRFNSLVFIFNLCLMRNKFVRMELSIWRGFSKFACDLVMVCQCITCKQ